MAATLKLFPIVAVVIFALARPVARRNRSAAASRTMMPGTAAAIGASPVDDIVHVIQVALAPAFLLSALATLLNVFSTRLGRVADKVDAIKAELAKADPAQPTMQSRRLAGLRLRSVVLEIAVLLASLAGVMTGVAVLTLFVGALRDASTATMLFGCFGAALVCTVAALVAFMLEIILAGRRIRMEVSHGQKQVSGG